MDEGMKLSEDDLVDNPIARVPLCLCLDVSGSMDGDPIRELNKGVRLFVDSLKDDEIAKYAVELAIVVFGGETACKMVEFKSIENLKIPEFAVNGETPMGQAIGISLDLLDKRKAEYSTAGVDYYQPWLVLMTDGKPTDNIDAAVDRVRQLVDKRKLSIFPIGIGNQADMATLSRLSPKRTPLKLKGLKFSVFFEWLSKSVSRVSQSIPGQKIPLDEEGIKGWSEL